MAFNADWSNTILIDHTKLNEVAAGMRATRVAVSDRLATIVSGFVAGETVLGILKLPFIAGSAPSTVTDQIQLYGKAVSTKTLLHMKDEDGTESMIVGLRTGDKLLSSNTTTPPDFTDQSATYEGKNIRISATALSTGGSDTLSGTTDSHTLTTSEMPAHTHTVGQVVGCQAGGSAAEITSSLGSTVTSGSTGGGGGHTHTLTAISCLNAYVTLKLYSKL